MPHRRSLPGRSPSHAAWIDLGWLVRLRWAAMLGQTATVVAVEQVLAVPLPTGALLAVGALEAASNVGAALWHRAAKPVGEALLAALLATDVLVLTALLYLSGGAFNPFSVLYLVPIAVGSLVLRERWTWGLVALSLGGSALLFAGSRELRLPASSHDEHMRIHLVGMWVAFGVCAAFLVYFLIRLRRARDAAALAARTLAAREEKLSALATLAAGAAHELATPLATIAVVAGELDRSLGAADAGAREDVATIRSEVGRCRSILDRMAADAGEPAGEALLPTSIGELVDALGRGAAALGDGEVRAAPGARDAIVEAPREALVQALRGLVKNARDASDAGASVTLAVDLEPGWARIEVRDRGAGLTPEALARAGEPFFTTKPPGRGMGLGVFLARTVTERIGGAFELAAREGGGTVARVRLPLAQPATHRRIAPAA